MAKLEIDLAPDEQARLVQEAQRAGLSVNEWARERLLGRPVVTFTAEDGSVYGIPDLPADLGDACARASEEVLKRVWEMPEEEAPWHSS